MFKNVSQWNGIKKRTRELEKSTIQLLWRWVKEAGESLSDEPQGSEIPEITEIDELFA